MARKPRLIIMGPQYLQDNPPKKGEEMFFVGDLKIELVWKPIPESWISSKQAPRSEAWMVEFRYLAVKYSPVQS